MATWSLISEWRSFVRNDGLFCLVDRPLERLIPFFFFGVTFSLRILVEGRIVIEIALCYFFDTSSATSLQQIFLKSPISNRTLTPFTCIIVQLFLPLHHVFDKLLALLRVLSKPISSLLDVLKDWSYAVLYLVELWLELGVVVCWWATGEFFLVFWGLVARSIEEVVGFSLERWRSIISLGVWCKSIQF